MRCWLGVVVGVGESEVFSAGLARRGSAIDTGLSLSSKRSSSSSFRAFAKVVRLWY